MRPGSRDEANACRCQGATSVTGASTLSGSGRRATSAVATASASRPSPLSVRRPRAWSTFAPRLGSGSWPSWASTHVTATPTSTSSAPRRARREPQRIVSPPRLGALLRLQLRQRGQGAFGVGLGAALARRTAQEDRLAPDGDLHRRPHRTEPLVGGDDAPLLRLDQGALRGRELGSLGDHLGLRAARLHVGRGRPERGGFLLGPLDELIDARPAAELVGL